MKKILLLLALIVAVLLLLPIIGNKIVENVLNEKIDFLKINGIELAKSDTKSSYFETKKHYEFLLSDSDKISQLLAHYSSYDSSQETFALLKGILIGIDLEYSNVPLSKAVSIDIYPISFSSEVMSEVKESDAGLHDFLIQFLEKKGVLYHIDYDMASSDFKGFIKDIKEEYTLANGAAVELNLLNATYSGNGELIAPKEFTSRVDTIIFKVKDENDTMALNMHNFTSDSAFESQSTYDSTLKLQKFEIYYKNMDTQGVEVNASDMGMKISSNTNGAKGEFSSKSSFKSLAVKSETLKIGVTNFNYEVALSGVEKDSFEEIRLLAAKLKTDDSFTLQQNLQESLIKLLSHGLTLNIVDFSLQKIVIDDVNDLEGFSIKSKMTLKEDADLKQKIYNAPMLVVGNINIETKIKFSKVMFDEITKNYPMTALVKMYAKDEANNLIFDMKFIDGALQVNDKPLNL